MKPATKHLLEEVAALHVVIANRIEHELMLESQRLLAEHPEVMLIAWCMGTASVVIKEMQDLDGDGMLTEFKVTYPDFDGNPGPDYLADFHTIADLDDRIYNVLTGRPRRYERKPDGSIDERTNW